MPIVTSEIVEDRAQRDGRRYVREAHTDHLGNVFFRSYLAANDQNVSAGLADAATLLTAQLNAQEIQTNAEAVSGEEAPSLAFRHSTATELAQEIRERFRTATGPIAARISARLLTLTDTQLRSLFSMTAAQVTALRTRLQAKVDAWTAARNLGGE